MKWYWICWTGLVILGACSVLRPRQVESAHHARVDMHDILVNQFAKRDTLVARSWHSGMFDGELAVFSPQGVVYYHPDSGLRGAMTEVRIYSARAEVVDSTYQDLRSEASHTAYQESLGQFGIADYSVSETVKPLPRFPQWGYVVLALVIGLWLIRKFR